MGIGLKFHEVLGIPHSLVFFYFGVQMVGFRDGLLEQRLVGHSTVLGLRGLRLLMFQHGLLLCTFKLL